MKVTTRPPTGDELAIGRGVPSGLDEQWRVFEIEEDHELRVFYADSDYLITTPEEWAAMPEHGLQVVSDLTTGGVRKCGDEYVVGGVSKFGIYLDDADYAAIEALARAVLSG